MHTAIRRLAVALLTPLGLTGCFGDVLTSSLEGLNFVFVTFNPVDNSGVSGGGYGDFERGERAFLFAATFSPTVVGQEYVAHRHTGTCSAIGTQVLTLPPVTGQPATTGGTPFVSVRVSLPTSYAKAAYVMDLHVTVAGVERRVACGSFA